MSGSGIASSDNGDSMRGRRCHMSTTTLARALRQPLTWLMIVAVALLALLALESTASGHAPSVVPFSPVPNSHTGDDPVDPPAHCDDGHGHDGDHNPHC